ncbi:MAG: hypothetical protein KDH20_11640 [Rhodocyclaceae bacterium]|nr:hypothetical protein [Rhodocyclaceae bacterium]
MRARASTWPAFFSWTLGALASLRLTLVLIVLLAPAVVLALNFEEWRSWPLAIPLAGLAVNLLAALATRPAFRVQPALVVFHLSLGALLLLIALGRLSYLRGTLELTEGALFDGDLTTVDAGPFHAGRLKEVRFAHDGFTIGYDPGLKRNTTRNPVRWLDESGRWRKSVIGDHHPLVIGKYRFYTSHNKGFAAVLSVESEGSLPRTTVVHFPSYPINEFGQTNELQLGDAGGNVWMLLDFDEVILDPARKSEFRLPTDYQLIVRDGDARHELSTGNAVSLKGVTLRFEGLRTWMGYNVFYDWTLPWLAATSALAVLSLGWHFVGKFRLKAWDN